MNSLRRTIDEPLQCQCKFITFPKIRTREIAVMKSNGDRRVEPANNVEAATIEIVEPKAAVTTLNPRPTTACALLQSALQKRTAIAKSQRRDSRRKRREVRYDETLCPISRASAAVVSASGRVRNRRKPRGESYPASQNHQRVGRQTNCLSGRTGGSDGAARRDCSGRKHRLAPASGAFIRLSARRDAGDYAHGWPG